MATVKNLTLGMVLAAANDEGSRCPCTNETAALASLVDRRCPLPGPFGDPSSSGVLLALGGPCVPLSYGSSRCLQHDLLHDPACRVDDSAGERVVPPYCFRPFCFVDAEACARDSDARVFRSFYFPRESGLDLFYSYAACNSTEEDWIATEGVALGEDALGGIDLEVAIPTYIYPSMFKRDGEGEILYAPGSEYFDSGVSFEGVYIEYMAQVMDISNGDIRNISYKPHSRASSIVHPASRFTAAAQDVQDGLRDMAVGPFWITGQRLRMTSFTIPVVFDKVILVIPRPDSTDALRDSIQKVLMPFSYPLWGLVIAIIVTSALLSVWFSDRSISVRGAPERNLGLPKTRRRKIAYMRLALDSVLQKGLFFCSAGVEQDEGGTLPNQLLMFGFGFFILIAVSAYVANLAAFLTRSSFDGVKTMEGAVAAHYTICAHPVLKEELQAAWPKAMFYFHEDSKEYVGMMDDYVAGKCKAMVVSWRDTAYDTPYVEMLCENKLVYTESLVIEMPMGFPVRRQLAAGISFWILEAEKYHAVSIKKLKEELPQASSCEIRYSAEDAESSEYDAITLENMVFPFMFFLACTIVAVVLQIVHQCKVVRGQESLIGRRSSMNLTEHERPGQQIPLVASLKNSIAKRRTSFDSTYDSNNDENEQAIGRGLHQRSRSIARGSVRFDGDSEDGQLSVQLDALYG